MIYTPPVNHPAADPCGQGSPQGAGSPPAAPVTLHPPPPILDHELLSLIGRGSYGQVWLARNRLGTLRAVKVVSRDAFEDRKPFEREFKGIQRFEPLSRSHDGLVDILQVGGDESHFYYVMELADDANAAGGIQNAESAGRKPASVPHAAPAAPSSYTPRTLRAEQQRLGRLPVGECVRIGRLLASALTHLHRHNLVHRDVKPSNIIFVEGQPKLADIGLVADLSEARSFVGTEGFIPPEGPGLPQADLYSLGKVLYEISTGRDRRDFPALPEEFGETPVEKSGAGSQKLEARRHEPGGERSAFLELNAVIARACQANPAQRYPSAEAMELDLALIEQGRSVRRKRGRQRRWAVARKAAGVALLLGLAGLGLHWLNRSQDEGVAATTPEIAFIFVLPFRHSAPGPLRREAYEIDQDVCLCGRITDAFIDGLGLIPGIRTGPRKSGWVRYDEGAVRHALVQTNDTRFILCGRVEHTNDVLRLDLKLYEREQEMPLWTAAYSCITNDLVALERRAIGEVAQRLKTPIDAAVEQRLGQALSNNLAAYGLLLDARRLYVLGFRADWYEAYAKYSGAVELDPRYGAAHAGIMMVRGDIGFDQPPKTVQTEVYERALRVLELDDTVLTAHTRVLFRLLYYDRNWEAATRYVQRMMVLWPDEDLEWAIWYRNIGRTNEAKLYHERLKHLPHPSCFEAQFIVYGELVWRNYDEAMKAATVLKGLYPEGLVAPYTFGRVHLAAGRYSEAIAQLKQASEAGPGAEYLGLLGRAYALAGDRTNALDMLRQLEQRVLGSGADPYYMGWIQSALGQTNEALASLERALEYRSQFLLQADFGGLRTDPAWDGLQGDPRFEALCQKVGMGKGEWPK